MCCSNQQLNAVNMMKTTAQKTLTLLLLDSKSVLYNLWDARSTLLG